MGLSETSSNAEGKIRKSAIESQIAAARQRRTTLEEDLKAMQEVVTNTETSLGLTRANICIMQERYDREVASMRSLEEELRTLTAILLEDAEATVSEVALEAPQRGRFKPFKSARKSFDSKSPKKE